MDDLTPEQICKALNEYDSGKGWHSRTDWSFADWLTPEFQSETYPGEPRRAPMDVDLITARALVQGWQAQEEVKRLNSLYLDKPGDRLYHAADKTWWRKDSDGTLKRAEPPIEIEGRLLEAQQFVDEAAHREIESLNKVLAAARAVINNPAWAGVCDEDIELEQAIREHDKEASCQSSQ